jgi:mono/diheme cytochrome c family protein
MSRIALVLLGLLVAVAAAAWYVRATGLSARAEPGAVEARLARAARRLAIPGEARDRQNPAPPSDAVLAEGRAHFADHCASCHANDGSGNTEMGRNLFPRAPDMRLPVTQSLTDGELFWIIENGIRFTGMPGWATGTPAGEEASWHLVHFVRRLPQLTPEEIEEMEKRNPRSPEEIRGEIEAERFLQGGDPPPAQPQAHAHEPVR